MSTPIELIPTTDKSLVNMFYKFAEQTNEVVKICPDCQVTFVTSISHKADKCLFCDGKRKTTEKGYQNRKWQEYREKKKEAEVC